MSGQKATFRVPTYCFGKVGQLIPWPKLLKGGYIRDYIGTTEGDVKGDTRSLTMAQLIPGPVSLGA